MTENVEVQAEAEAQGPFMIETIDQFAYLVKDWHTNAINTLKHMLEVPTGMEVVIEGEEPFNLEGEIQRGFKLGINLALNYIGTLPFGSAPDPDESKPN